MSRRLEELLRQHREDRFPDSIDKGAEYGAVDAVMIDADIFGWALGVSGGQRLSVTERGGLQRARDDLARSLDAVPDRARPYFQRLLVLADEALTAGGGMR